MPMSSTHSVKFATAVKPFVIILTASAKSQNDVVHGADSFSSFTVSKYSRPGGMHKHVCHYSGTLAGSRGGPPLISS